MTHSSQNSETPSILFKRTHLIIAVAAVIAMALIGAPVIAKKVTAKDDTASSDSGEGWQGKGFGRPGGRFSDDGARWIWSLDLTADQKAKVRALRDEARRSADPLREQMWTLEKQIRKKWAAADPDERAIRSLQRDIHELRGELEMQQIQNRIDVLSILTEKQRAEMQSVSKKQCRGV